MDWYKAIILVICTIAVVASPVMFVRAYHRRDKSRVFDIVLSEAFLIYLTLQNVWPNVTEHLPTSVRWLLVPLPILLIANCFGLSRWLFKTQKPTSRTPRA